MKLKGKVWKFGANVNTDEIIPASCLITTDPQELAKHCMAGITPGFSSRVSNGDIIVAGKNFGCGSSREHAPLAIKAVGITCVVAESFARIFFRNAINIGLPILECAGISESVREGDILEIELNQGIIRNLKSGETCHSQPFPPFMQELIQAGGLMSYIKQQYRKSTKGKAKIAKRTSLSGGEC